MVKVNGKAKELLAAMCATTFMGAGLYAYAVYGSDRILFEWLLLPALIFGFLTAGFSALSILFSRRVHRKET